MFLNALTKGHFFWNLLFESRSTPHEIKSQAHHHDRAAFDAVQKDGRQLLRTIVENAPDFTYLWRLPHDTIIYVNRDQFLGYSRDEIMRSGFIATRLYAEDAGRYATHMKTVVAGGDSEVMEYRLYHKEGHWEYIEQHETILERDASGKPKLVLVTLRVTTELHRAPERWRTMYNKTPVMMHYVQNGVIVAVNSYWLEMTGYERHEVLGRRLFDFFTEESRQYALSDVLPFFEKSHVLKNYEFQMVKKDGSIMDILLSSSAEVSDDGLRVGALSVIVDVTERNRFESALRQSESHLRAIWENATDAMLLTDPEGLVVAANPALERMLGCRLDDLVGSPVWRFLSDEGHDTVYRLKREDFQTFEPALVDQVRIQHSSDGERIAEARLSFLTEGDRRIALLSILRDVTERQRLEDDLRFQASIFQNVSDAIIVADRDFRIQNWNPAAERIYGWRAEEVIGRYVEDVIDPQGETSAGKQAFELARRYEQDYWNFESVHYRKDGSRLDALVSSALLKDKNGIPTSSVHVIRDVTEQKQAEAELREREARNRALINAIPDLIVRIDRYGNYIEVWPSKIVLDYEPVVPAEALAGRNILDLFSHDVALPILERIRLALQTRQIQTYEYQLTEHHTIRHYESRWVAYTENEVFGLVRDITGRKNHEARLERQASIFESVEEAIIVTELVDGKYCIVSWNPAAEAMYGWQASEVTGRPVADVVRPEYPQGMTTEQALAELERGGYWTNEIVHHHRDGHPLDVLISTTLLFGETHQPAGSVIIALDITRRKQAEIALRMSEERFQIALRGAPITVANQDADLRYTWIHNPTSPASPEAMLGKRDVDLLDNSEDARQLEKLKRQVMETGRGLRREVRLQQGGDAHYYDLTLEPLKDDSGSVVGITLAQVDITERKQAEERELQLALERERILMLRRFMGDVSHDFKTPLASIKLSTYMLNKVHNPEEQERHIRVIDMQVDRLEKLMSDLFTMSRLDMEETQEFNFGPVDLNDLLHSVIAAHDPVIRQRKHTVRMEQDDQLRPVPADRFQLDRVFTNLLVNAVHYTPEGGEIVIRTRQGDNEAIVEVEDNGIGIDVEAQEMIFTRFYRADPSRNPNMGGMGVGLAIALKIVETHEGRIDVQSNPGKGSIFTVLLPQL